MANIATVQVRLFPKDKVYLPVGKILNVFLKEWGDKSYYVPVHVTQDELTEVTDIQFGARWSGVGDALNVWEWDWVYRDLDEAPLLKAIWWREFDDGGDYDKIGWIDETNFESPALFKLCRYGFDAIKVTWKSDTIEEFGLHWQKQGQVWTTSVKGSYLAGNDRCRILLKRPNVFPMPTKTTLTYTLGGSLQLWEDDQFDPSLSKLFTTCALNASKVDFYWRGRLVRIENIDTPDRYSSPDHPYWQMYHLDHWDNCVDPDWLAFNAALEKPTSP